MKRSTFGVLVILFVIVISMLSSCTEVARQNLTKIKTPINSVEKVVILNRFITNTPNYSYKVKRIEKGVVTFIELPLPYEIGDTIFHRFDDNIVR
jgi:hypothetical protein